MNRKTDEEWRAFAPCPIANVVRLQEHIHKPEEKISVQPYTHDLVDNHIHDCFELAYVIQGGGIHILNDTEQIEVKEGDFFIIDYGTVHRYAECRNMIVINCLFYPEVIHDTLAESQSFEEVLKVCLMRYYRRYFSLIPTNRVFRDEDGTVGRIMKEMQQEYERKLPGYEEMFRSCFIQILIHIMRKICFAQGAERYSETVESMIQYLNDHYREEGVVGEYCRRNHYSQQYISRRFHQETGITAREYLQKIRIEKSCGLLLETEKTISEIAQLVGYGDVKFFQKLFHKMMRMSPRDYRRMKAIA